MLLDLQLADRVSYDAERNILFVNFEGMAIRSDDDIECVRRVFEALCKSIGRQVALIVNYELPALMTPAHFAVSDFTKAAKSFELEPTP